MKKSSLKDSVLFTCSLLSSILFVSCSNAENGNSLFPLPESRQESSIYLDPIENIPNDFIRGMDASSVLVEEKSGVKYYNFAGEEEDVFKTLAESGVNYIRLRVWNDPYDSNGRGYGGGNNDLATAIELGKRATKYGMKVFIDFHYSDFWADPKRQLAPKAWKNLDIDKKAKALEDFTKESLTKIIKEGVNVGMVQIGNEINFGLAGETKIINIMKLLRSASGAVRQVSKKLKKDIKIAVHYTQIMDSEGIDRTAATLANMKVDYDVFGLSYYPFWHGSYQNMQKVVKNLREKYNKMVIIAETSYCYTSEDGDGFGNSISGKGDTVPGYPATVQGQAWIIRDVCEKSFEAGASGVFYWEGVWIPVGKCDREANTPIWEKYGSGWATSYSKDYDPEDAGLYYGGCSWDNQALFDFEGHPLPSLNVFKYLRYGSSAPLRVDDVPDLYTSCNVGSQISLPEKVPVIYNDRSKNTEVSVEWNKGELESIDTKQEGDYTITGKLEDGSEAKIHVSIKMLNFVKNPSFEEEDTSVWKIDFAGEKNPADFQKKADDAHSGDTSLHFWAADNFAFTVEQKVTGLENGSYRLFLYAQGGDAKKESTMELYAKTKDGEQKESFMVTGWKDWKKPTIQNIKVTDGTLTFGVRTKLNAKAWGTFDDFTLNRIGD
ncbi:glycosyl hydrolase family 53 [Treponema ruminis]|uniref:Arabinogalactan endo-beta-1,4-galactanase n=1 Tax=Treponema ruminis TaxID=744515 RepID=A0A7W8G7U2_9SPIR|nr:glycosyl hydrolase 53 family protein [Treponema ruminis]MBB5225329.1 arabinogalactan endo-1,4-beta-galactosidase [Treponema ruminis]QSI01800.1 glycosyl hydrolase family 53 [Treponema ruminis]